MEDLFARMNVKRWMTLRMERTEAEELATRSPKPRKLARE
jgi:hypothetical protein